jgi:hypothetical protein
MVEVLIAAASAPASPRLDAVPARSIDDGPARVAS